MKIKSFLMAFFALVISCSAFSQDNDKGSTMHHHSKGKHHHKHHKKHHKHMMNQDSKGGMKDKKMDNK